VLGCGSNRTLEGLPAFADSQTPRCVDAIAATSADCIWLNSVGMWNEGCAQKAQIVSCCDANDKNWGEEIGDPGSPGFDDPAPGGGQVVEGIEGAVLPPEEEPGDPVVFPVNVRIPPLPSCSETFLDLRLCPGVFHLHAVTVYPRLINAESQ